jgi:HK97 family phage major capsid protein
MNKQATLAKLAADAKAKRAELEALHEAGKDIAQEDRNNLQKMIDDAKVLKAEIEQEQDVKALEEFVNTPVNGRQTRAGAPRNERKTWGDIVVESKQFETASQMQAEKMDRVQVKDLHGVTTGAGGALVEAMYDTELVGLPQRPRSILDLITVAQTGSNSVEFARQTSRTNNAAVVAEYDTVGGDFNLKPKSNIVFELVTAAVKTIPTYVVASRNILSDAPQLRSLINEELTYMVRKELEDQIVAGDGSSGSFTGILNTSGIQTRTQQSTGDRGGLATDTKAGALRRAITDVELEFYEVTGIMLHPANAEALELEKDDDKNYVNIYDPVAARLWRVPVVESSAMTSGKALVGNFRLGATLWDRQATDIRVGEPGDMFLQNAVAVLAELRAAFAVKRPSAFERVTFA